MEPTLPFSFLEVASRPPTLWLGHSLPPFTRTAENIACALLCSIDGEKPVIYFFWTALTCCVGLFLVSIFVNTTLMKKIWPETAVFWLRQAMMISKPRHSALLLTAADCWQAFYRQSIVAKLLTPPVGGFNSLESWIGKSNEFWFQRIMVKVPSYWKCYFIYLTSQFSYKKAVGNTCGQSCYQTLLLVPQSPENCSNK